MPSQSARLRAAVDDGSTAAVTVLRPILACARAKRVAVDALLGELEVNREQLDNADTRVPDEVHDRAWRECAARSGDELFGFHVTEFAHLGAYDALDYAMWASATLGDALDRLERFHAMLCDGLAMSIETHGSTTCVRRLTERHGRHAVEYFLAFVILRARELTGKPIAPREVQCAHAAPPDTEPLEAFFHCPVRFARITSQIELDAADLALPVTTAKPGLAEVLDRFLRAALARLPRRPTFLDRVRGAVADTLSRGHRPTLAMTARALRASPRTVQRRLLELGTSHREVLDAVRRGLAHRLLDEQHLSVTETAFLLGFSDVSGFRRTFMRWTGRSPTQS